MKKTFNRANQRISKEVLAPLSAKKKTYKVTVWLSAPNYPKDVVLQLGVKTAGNKAVAMSKVYQLLDYKVLSMFCRIKKNYGGGLLRCALR